MKLLYCLAGTFNSGGMERIVLAKAAWLAEEGYEIIIVTTEQKGRKDFYPLHKNIKRVDLDIMYSETNGFNPLKKAFARSKRLNLHKKLLTKVVEKEKPNVIISTFGNEIGIIPKIKYKCVKIAEIHFSRWYRLQLNRKGIWFWIDRFLTHQDSKVLSKYDKFVALTNEDALNWEGRENLFVIPNFISCQAPSPALLINKRMIAVGRLSYQKGYDMMIKAWKIVTAKYPEWRLDIFGAGELKDEITELIDKNNLKNQIRINKPTSKINIEYENSSSLLLTSRYEGLPMVLLEAMSVGLPCIAFKCQCGPKDIIHHFDNGILIEEGEIEEFAKAIITLIEDDELRLRLGNQAYQDAAQYTLAKIMPKWEHLFKTLVKKKI